MSNSFVPKIEMSKGTARKNSFDISCNTHTTAEVGYIQPTYSQYLLPNSDLKIKADDTVLMSSLICPTFGDLSLRHWFMATPVSSLWACLGAYLSQRSFNDLDSPSGHSIPQMMPKYKNGILIRDLVFDPIYRYLQVLGTKSVANMPCPVQLLGNLTYPCKPSSDLKRRTNEIYDFNEFEDLLLKSRSEESYFDSPVDVLSHYSNNTDFQLQEYETDKYSIVPFISNLFGSDDNYRYCPLFPWWWTGVVVKNTDALRAKFSPVAGATNTFPTKEECPFVVLFVQDITKPWFNNSTYDEASGVTPFTGSKQGGLMVVPLTNRMFAGDTDPVLYRDGWRNDVVYYDDDLGLPYLEHPTGASFGWALQNDDAYFVGDLFENPFDIGAVQMYLYDNDLDLRGGGFFACHRLSRRFKRIRKIFIGLGSQFNPFDSSDQLPWKIMSYYKAWFDNFYPKREIQYYQTPLARFVNYISYHGRCNVGNFTRVFIHLNDDETFVESIDEPYHDFVDMIYALGDAKYLMPLDYFSLADKNPLDMKRDGTYDADEYMPVLAGISNLDQSDEPGYSGTFGTIKGPVYENVGNFSSYYSTLNGWAVKMADKMLSYLTKKRVVGKSVSDTMRAIFGAVDEHDKAHESTWCFGTHSTPIKIRAITSTTENEEIHLGDYAGQGIGGSATKTFKIDNNADLICVVVMSAVVPRMSYFQGTLHENLIGDSPNDFCKPIWDAVGYDDVYVEEYISDATDKNDLRNPSVVPSARGMKDLNGKSLGLVPKYTWAKVSRDILNGDMSLPSLRASMNPYVLTRNVPVGFGTDPIEMRTINPDDFNKIFNESSSLDDHFIIQIGFRADAYKPLKSISTSFEDFDSDEDGTISVEHS